MKNYSLDSDIVHYLYELDACQNFNTTFIQVMYFLEVSIIIL
jgi:hypothetical protein